MCNRWWSNIVCVILSTTSEHLLLFSCLFREMVECCWQSLFPWWLFLKNMDFTDMQTTVDSGTLTVLLTNRNRFCNILFLSPYSTAVNHKTALTNFSYIHYTCDSLQKFLQYCLKSFPAWHFNGRCAILHIIVHFYGMPLLST